MTNDIYIASCHTWLASQVTSVNSMVLKGLYNKTDADESGYYSISQAPSNLSAPEIGCMAAKSALEKACIQGDALESIIYNAIHRHGYPQLWCPASYIQKMLKAESAFPLTINQGCNSQLLSIQVTLKILSNNSKDYGLIVASDKFSGSGFNRWNSDYGIIYGDAAAAVVLSKKSGIAKIMSIYTVSDPDLELLHRSEVSYDESDNLYAEKHYNVRLIKKQFMEKNGKNIVSEKTNAALKQLWDKTFSSDDISPDQIKYFIFPNLGQKILKSNYYPMHQDAEKKSLWYFGSNVGHLGASDCIAGLSHLFEEQKIKSGDKVLCVGAGSGFSWTFMLIEVV